MKSLNLILFSILIINVVYSQGRYYKAQMHCHTTNSDGNYSPQDLAIKYKNAGYEILMITDHNHLTLEDEVNVEGMLVIQSEEITFDRHMNGFFLTEQIIPTENFTCFDAISEVKAQNGLIMLNHYRSGPFTNSSWAVNADEILTFDELDMLEIWNTGTETVQTHDDKSVWDAVLTAGKVVWGCATDDFHPSVSEALEFNKGWNMIWLESLTTENVYNALKNGQFYASTGVNITNYTVTDFGSFKTIYVESDDANKIAFWGPNHQKIQETNGNSAQFILQNHDFVRVELIKEGFLGTNKKYAWTQPVFLNPVTNIEKEPELLSVTIYPNPVKNTTNIKINNIYPQNIKINIKDISGHIVKSIFKGFVNAETMTFSVDLSSLNAGLYLTSIETENQTIVRKLVVN